MTGAARGPEAVASRPRPLRAARIQLLTPHSQPALDALRGAAAVAIVVKHVAFQTGASQNGTLGALTARLDVGVAVFFVLSGYLLTAPYVRAAQEGRPRPAARRYFWHRCLRILPAYWLACAAALLLVPENRGVPLGVALRNVLLLQVYHPGDMLTGFTQTWSLCTEVAFYLVLPLLAVALVRSARRSRPTSAVVVVAGLVLVNSAFLVFVRSGDVLDRALGTFWLPSYLSWFAAGMGLAFARRADPAARLRSWLDAAAHAPLACWTIAAAALLLATTSVAGPQAFESVPTIWQDVSKNLLYLVIAVALMVPLAFGDDPVTRVRQHLSSAPWRFVGEISYGVFLWHLMVIQLLAHVRGDAVFQGDFVPMLALTLIGTGVVATASLLLLERPMMRLRNHGPGRPRPTGPQSSGDDGGTTATAASAAASPS